MTQAVLNRQALPYPEPSTWPSPRPLRGLGRSVRACAPLALAGALAVYAFLVPFGSEVIVPAGPPPFNTLSSLMGLVVMVAAVVTLATTRAVPRLPPSPVMWWTLVAVWLTVTVLWSVDVERSRQAMLILLSLLALYVLACVVPPEAHRLRWLEAGAAAGAVYVALRGMALLPGQGLADVAAQRENVLPRYSAGASADPNITAASLLLGWVCLTWWAVHATTRRRRAVATAASSLVVAAILLTASRGGLVALLVTTVLLVALTDRRRRRGLVPLLGLAAIAAAVAWTLAPPELQNRLLQTSSTGRTDIWRMGVTACPDTCWVGNGWSTFPSVYQAAVYDHLELVSFRDQAFVAHNIAVSMLVEGGVVGTLLLVIAFGALVRGLRRLPHALRGPPLCAVVALVVTNMFVSNLNFKYFWLTLLYATVASARVPATVPIRFASGGQS